jgi:hypothetical protein
VSRPGATVPALAVRAFALLAGVLGVASRAHAEDPPASFSSAAILREGPPGLSLVSTTVRITAYDQFGTGYQSKFGPVSGPGSERLTVFEPQTEVVMTQGDRVTHRVWIPVDIVSEASPIVLPKPVDVVSGASAKSGAGGLQWSTIYRANRATDLSMTTGAHLEPPFRSWNGGVGASHGMADRDTVVSGAIVGIFDWFDRFLVNGVHHGRTERSTTMGSAAVTQVLTPTTVVSVNYGLTIQNGTLGNTWNAVPLANGTRGTELLPSERVRHALVGRLAQFLPWNGALRLYYRFYDDDWGIVAHSVEGQLLQRLTPTFYFGAVYRFHTQTSPPFFTTLAPLGATLRVADSDLAALQSQTLGGKAIGDVPLGTGTIRQVHYEIEYDRYQRTNDLRVDLVSCSVGLRF